MRRVELGAGGEDRRLFACAILVTLAAGLLGGASRAAPLRLAVVELVALPLLMLAVRRAARDRRADPVVVILVIAAAIPLLQLVPAPPAIWLNLPGGADRALALSAAGAGREWEPASLFPRATLDALLALAPPAAVFLATPQLDPDRRRAIAALWLALAAAGIALGAAQLAQPAGGWPYPFADTNQGSLVGLFANRNHEAGFLLALIPITAAQAVEDGRWRRRAILALFALTAIVALGVVRSRAGVILAGPAIVGGLAVLARSRVGRGGVALATLAALAGVVAVGAFAATPILERFAPSAAPEARFEAWPTVVTVARASMPLGAGVGAFDRVFRAAEPLALVGPTFFNHAHDEYLELWLETGVAGLALLAAFLAWFLVRAVRAWRGGGSPMARAASLAIGVLLAQSAVDYPLRTESLACLFAFACGCLAAPPARSHRAAR